MSEERYVYTVKQLAQIIKKSSKGKEKLPSKVKVVNGTIDLTEGANISVFGRRKTNACI